MNTKKTVLLLVLVAAVAVIAIFALSRGKTASSPVAVGLHAPDFVVMDGMGKKLSLADFKGKVVFVNFWASWCDPCKEEMPSVDSLAKDMAANGSFIMVTVLYNDSPENGLEYMRSRGYTFPVYTDPDGASARNYGVTGVPETYIVDKDGILRKKVIGAADWNSPAERNLLDYLLK